MIRDWNVFLVPFNVLLFFAGFSCCEQGRVSSDLEVTATGGGQQKSLGAARRYYYFGLETDIPDLKFQIFKMSTSFIMWGFQLQIYRKTKCQQKSLGAARRYFKSRERNVLN